MTDQYAVFGNPVAQSKSPTIHKMFAGQTGEDLHYSKQQVVPGRFEEAADVFFAAGGKGLNITVPFKQDAYRYAARLTARARRAGAVNTLTMREGVVQGDTTDGVGMIRDITKNLCWPITGQRVLILGAGGAVRGVLEPLLEEAPQHVVIANRTLEKAMQLSKAFAEMGYLLGCDLDMLSGQQFDLIINGTSASLQGELPPLPDDLLAAGGRVYDMMYAAEPTVFMRWAQQRGAAEVADGLGMLVEQAAESFSIWRGVQPETRPVIAAIRQELVTGG
ncbi:MAG: shikimate dehydrogenase [Porticoccaceae bacterium]|nr:shikimate dehydrogenase [Pseudomonadales bacterium]MCP5172965.1 shikimate dehydrogenase [Pseudomonadales bacterium]MCP5302438.1 shikimate dehydrogenase [Pseudomonadales bacterium]